MNRHRFLFVFLVTTSLLFSQQNFNNKVLTERLEWNLSELMNNPVVEIKGSPKIIETDFGWAVWFNGSSDGIFVDEMPLKGLSAFTVEVVFRPDSGGGFEQRFFHCGEVAGSRVMIELRSVSEGWYFDAYVNANGVKKALIDSSKIHLSNVWYHAAFVIDNGNLTTYINGKKELNEFISFSPFFKGKTSFGVRQNLVSWYKGAIYKLIITARALRPCDFSYYPIKP